MRMLLAGAAAIGAVAGAGEARAQRLEATIVRTTYGIPHITARDWAGIGYGVGYAYAQDNLCLLAEEFVTVAGERSRHFGPKASAVLGFGKVDNLSSDLFFRSTIDVPALRKSGAKRPRDEQRLVAGYVAGYNRRLRDLGPERMPADCRGKAWVRPITGDDMLRMTEKSVLLASSLALAPFVANAAPPGAQQASASDASLPDAGAWGVGSNGWAFGGDVTADGRGLLVGNPHFPWHGPARFWQLHMTIPGTLDVMGATIAGTPLVSLGFNRDVAWTHTVTEARHFTLYELALDPNDPLTYRIDGKPEKMRRVAVTVPMPEGTPPVTRTLYASRYGPMLVSPFLGLGWTKERAFAIRDANRGNQRGLAAWMRIGQARSVADVRAAVSETLGIPWVNTIAADRGGNALHADVTAVPNVSAAIVAACTTPRSAMLARRVTLLDGSRSACAWSEARGTPAPGLMRAVDQAVYLRRDYVANSNDSYWLSNPKAPYAALSPILGSHGIAQSLRTRSGLIEIGRALQAGKISRETAKTLAFANKSLAAELVVDRVLALCVGNNAAAAACAALRGWDRRFDVDSRGAYLFHLFWTSARALPNLWAVPFDASDPVNTPRDLVTQGEAGSKLIAALVGAADKLTKDGIAFDARWGDVHFAMRGDDRVPVHGGDGAHGVLNVQMSDPAPGGLTPRHGTSYIQVVGFDERGPVADAVLSYSQSTDPASPHFGDQTRLYARKGWHRLPFTAAEIAADGAGAPLKISE
jgi:acyl-homoserine-lactone acylase